MNNKDLVLTLPQRLFLFVCIFLLCYAITIGASFFIGRILSGNPAAALRISTVIQDVIAFVVPAVATAVLCTRRPAELLCLTESITPIWIILIGALLFISIPFQEAIIYWNQNLHFPDWMAGFEQSARQMEETAAAATRLLTANGSILALIVNILIIGVAAGVSEELLFRGCFQRLLTTAGINHHAAIWSVAIVFSVMHFQLFGFVPRVLLGAYFGYLLYWSKSVWVPATAHMLNNTLYVISAWGHVRLHPDQPLDTSSTLYPWWIIAVSALFTCVALWMMFRTAKSKE